MGRNEIFVELSCWPKEAHLGNVSAHPCFRKNRLDVDQTEGTFSLNDIYVGAFSDRLYLTLKKGGKEVVACLGSLLNSRAYPAPLQFMREVSLARKQLIYPFYLGSLSKHACLFPRVRFQRTILSPMQWNVDSSHFALKGDLEEQFSRWAEFWRLPNLCFLVRIDQQLLIDRTHPAHLKEIIAKLKKSEPLQFIEYIESPWVKSARGHHLSEFVIPLLKNPDYLRENYLEANGYLLSST